MHSVLLMVSITPPSRMLEESAIEDIMVKGRSESSKIALKISKLGNIQLANEYANRLRDSGVVSVSLRMSIRFPRFIY